MNRQDPERTRLLILEAAVECFAERGFAGASLREVARRAGVTQPLIHHYFGSKAELWSEALRDALRHYEQLQAPQWARAADDPQFLLVGLRVLFEWLGQNQKLLRLSLWALLEEAPLEAEGQAVFEEVRAHLEGGKACGLLRQDLDVEAGIVLLDALLKGYWQRRAVFALYEIDEAELDERVFRELMQLVIRGFFSAPAVETTLQAWEASLSPRSSCES